MPSLIRFDPQDDQRSESWGIQTSEGIRDLGTLLGSCPTMLDAIAQWDSIGPRIASIVPDAPLVDGEVLPPVPDGGRIICIGLNYRDHAIETGAEIPTEPVVFCKLRGALCADGEPIILPRVSSQVDFEAELVMVVGKSAHCVSEAEAMDYVFGYACGHDVSARDWQKGRPGGQWLLGKSFPNFAPLGPTIVPKEEIEDVNNLKISLRINGETMQDSSTSQLIFPPSHLISYLSHCTLLEPGDVIYTGTPPGVGAARTPPRFLAGGDVCEVEIEGIGKLSNPVLDAE